MERGAFPIMGYTGGMGLVSTSNNWELLSS